MTCHGVIVAGTLNDMAATVETSVGTLRRTEQDSIASLPNFTLRCAGRGRCFLVEHLAIERTICECW